MPDRYELEARIEELNQELAEVRREISVHKEDLGDKSRSEPVAQSLDASYQEIPRTVADGIMTIDDHGIVLDLNLSAQRMFGFDAAEIIGQNVKMLIPEPYFSGHDSYIYRNLETGE